MGLQETAIQATKRELVGQRISIELIHFGTEDDGFPVCGPIAGKIVKRLPDRAYAAAGALAGSVYQAGYSALLDEPLCVGGRKVDFLLMLRLRCAKRETPDPFMSLWDQKVYAQVHTLDYLYWCGGKISLYTGTH